MSAITRIKQIRSEIAGPILYQGLKKVEWNNGFRIDSITNSLTIESLNGLNEAQIRLVGNGSINSDWSFLRFENISGTNLFHIRSNGTLLQIKNEHPTLGGQFVINQSGRVSIGLNGSVLGISALLNLSSPFAAAAHINFQPDIGYITPVDGDLWYTGTALNFRNGLSTINLLAGGGSGGGSVTSIAITGNSVFQITGSPITTNGIINIDFSSQLPGQILASPVLITGQPTFRNIAITDLPNSGATAGTWNNVTINSKGIVTSATNQPYITGTLTSTFLPRWNGLGLINSSFFENNVLINQSSEFKNIKIGSGLGLIEFDDFGQGSGSLVHGFTFYNKSIIFDDGGNSLVLSTSQIGSPSDGVDVYFSAFSTFIQANGTAATSYQGFQYAADYSPNFIARSLVDKAYVDSLIQTNNGITRTLNTIQLGGPLVQNTEINGLFDFRLGNITRLNTFTAAVDGAASISSVWSANQTSSTVSVFQSLITLNANNSGLGLNSILSISADGDQVSLDGSIDNAYLIRDDISSKGLVGYQQFSNLTDNSYVQKKWVDDNFLSSSLILQPINGGTGTNTVFTDGSVIFAGPSGIYQQNNSNFFWNNITARLGIGTNLPQRGLHTSTFRTESVVDSWLDVQTWTLNTIDGNTQNLALIPVPIGTSVTIEARVQCIKTAGGGVGAIGDSCSYIRTVKAKNVSGNATLAATQSTFTSEDPALTPFNVSFDASGANIRVRIIGSANNIVTWNGTIIITK